MFDLEVTDRNQIIINDARSGSKLVLYYRTPTPQEEVSYSSAVFRRKGKKVIINEGKRIAIGKDILTGFQEGDFVVGKKKISSDPENENYRPDWKELFDKTARHLLRAVSIAVFEGTTAEMDNGDVEVEAVLEDDVPPLG